MARIIRAFEPVMHLPDTVAELRPIYLHVLRGKRVLLILDNASDGNQVAPLLPPEECALIVTSRRRIAVAGLERIDLDLLAPNEARGFCARSSATFVPQTRTLPASRSSVASCRWRCVWPGCSLRQVRIGQRTSTLKPLPMNGNGLLT
jgi:hypothetical protein